MDHLRQVLLRSIRPIHERFRHQKMTMFLETIKGVSERGSLLDVGGGPGINGEFLSLYSSFQKVVVVNVHPQNLDCYRGCHIQALVADGRRLPFDNASFDWVFSNAVIEHVGQYQEQHMFASEIRRVAAKGYFVTCPNKYFPLEPHTLIPFYQFLPKSAQKRIALYSPGYVKQYEEINLLTPAQLRQLFPEARVRSAGFPIFGNSIVAYYRGENQIA